MTAWTCRSERGVVLQHHGAGVRREVPHLLPRLQQLDPRLPPLPQRRKLPLQRPVLGQEHLREQRHVRLGLHGAQEGTAKTSMMFDTVETNVETVYRVTSYKVKPYIG